MNLLWLPKSTILNKFSHSVSKLTQCFPYLCNNIGCIFLILLIYDITNPNSKTENYTCIQTSFCNVNINNASSGLRENVILTKWDSHHSITNTYSFYNTLSHRAWYVCSNQHLLVQENQHIHTSLKRCNYPDWVFHKLQMKMNFQFS